MMFPGAVSKGLGNVGNCGPSALFASAAVDKDSFGVVMNLSLHGLVEARFPIASPIHKD